MPVFGSELGLLWRIVHETRIYTVAAWQKVTLFSISKQQVVGSNPAGCAKRERADKAQVALNEIQSEILLIIEQTF